MYGINLADLHLWNFQATCLLPSFCLLLWTPWAVYRSLTKPVCIRRTLDLLLATKLFVASVLIAEQLQTLSFDDAGTDWHWYYNHASNLDGIALATLLFVNHRHDKRPSTIPSLFLVLSVVVTTTLRGLSLHNPLLRVTTLPSIQSLALRGILLFLHEYPRRPQLLPELQQELGWEWTRGYWTHTLAIWMVPDFVNAGKNPITPTDLSDSTDQIMGRITAEAFNTSLAKNSAKRNALIKVCYSLQKWCIMKAVSWQLVTMSLRLSLPLLIFQYTSFLEKRREIDMRFLDVLVCPPTISTAAVFVALMISRAVSDSADTYIKLTTQYMVTNAVGRKLLRLSSRDASIFAKIPLLTEHICNIEENLSIAMKAFTNVVEIMVTLFIICNTLGQRAFIIASIALGTSLVVFALLQIDISSKKLWANDTQHRLTQIQQLISPIKETKMMDTKDITQYFLRTSRENETASRNRYWMTNAHTYGIVVSIHALTPAVALYLYQQDKSLHEATPTLLSFLTAMVMLSRALGDVPEFPGWWSRTHKSFNYVEEFLRVPSELDEDYSCKSNDEHKPEQPFVVEFSNVALAPHDATTPILNGIDTSFLLQSITVVTGGSGAGKTLFLSALVNRDLIVSGTLTINEDAIGYCGQHAWVQNLSIRDNIVNSTIFDNRWYRRVVRMCCLEDDIDSLPGRDRFVAGRFGMNLNHSLRHRVVLARAVYSRAKLLVIDDIFATQNASTTHQLIARLFSPTSFVRRHSTIIIAATETEPFHGVCDRFLKIRANGQLVARDANGANDNAEQPNHTLPEYVKQISEATMTSTTQQFRDFAIDIDTKFGQSAPPNAAYESPSYSAILKRLNRPLTILCLSLLIGQVILEELPILALRQWFSCFGTQEFPHLMSISLTACSGLIYTAMLHTFRQDILSEVVGSIYDSLVDLGLGASITSMTPGNIIKYSYLIGEGIRTMDQSLYQGTFNLALSFITVTSGLTFAASQHIFGTVLYPICYLFLYAIYALYGPIAYQLLQLQKSTYASLCTAFAETAVGSDHIRTLRSQTFQARYLKNTLEDAIKVQAHMLTSKRWLSITVDTMLAILTCTTVTIGIQKNVLPYKAGISLFIFIYMRDMAMKLFSSLGKLDSCAIALQQMESLETRVQREPNPVEGPAYEVWPGPGHIQLKNARIGYDSGLEASMLHNVSINIPAATQTGVYGSLGCGKTTLALGLLNHLPYTGSITIDDVEVRDIPYNAYRSLFTVIPQRPVIYPDATIRQNLIPDEMLLDHLVADDTYELTIEYVLYNTGLFDVVQRVGGLTTPFAELNLTPEQLQRFSVAKGLMEYCIHRGKVIIVDGATSYVNAQTLQQLRDVMEDVFLQNECTILTTSNNEHALHGSQLVFGIRHGNVLRLIGPNPVDD